MSPIRFYPDPALSKSVSPFAVTEAQAQQYFSDMTQALVTRPEGIALAANQIGIDAAMFIYIENGELLGILNPTILSVSNDMVTGEEGCLSLDTRHSVPRYSWIRVYYTVYPGMYEVITKIKGTQAQIFQHEMDHLRGRMINVHS